MADRNHSAGDILKAGDHAQNCRFTAPGRTQKDNELIVLDVEIDAMDNGKLTERLDDLLARYLRHLITPARGAL